MRLGMLAIAASLLAPMLVEASEPVWVFIEPPSAEDERDFKKAKEDAKADIAAGVLKVGRGGFTIADEERKRLLAKLGIEEVEGGCVVIESVYSRVYHAAIETEIERRYGTDFWSRFNAELEASRETASSGDPKRDPAADGKYWTAVADHIASYWKVPLDAPGWHRCSALIRFDAHLASAETEFLSCPDDDGHLESSIAQAVQASLPLPAEIAALRTPSRVLITFAVSQDEEVGDSIDWPEWQSIKDFIKKSTDPTQ